jgi:cob(I)alamin adenosyltransferase
MTKETDEEARYKRRMQRTKEAIDKKVAAATEERGIVIVLTGPGKGKSSSGFGNVIRCLGHGFKAGVVQFIKGTWDCGERNFLEDAIPGLEFHVMGTGFTWETQDLKKDRDAAIEAWQHAKSLLQNPDLRLVLFDELTYVINYGHVSVEDVIDALKNRPKDQTVIITGRGAPAALMNYADTVSEIKSVKHAFDGGVKAQKGIDY